MRMKDLKYFGPKIEKSAKYNFCLTGSAVCHTSFFV